jgi:hypothetical protein
MAKLLICSEGGKSFIYHLPLGETKIGREDGCQLRLPGSDIAREQLILRVEAGKVTRKALAGGSEQRVRLLDELQLGGYRLIYMEDDQRIFKGIRLAELPLWDVPKQAKPEPIRRGFSPEQVLNLAKVEEIGGFQRSWSPGYSMTFGSGAQVAVNDLLAWGVVARIKWDGRCHLLCREAWWMGISVDGKVGPELKLSDGCIFSIGAAEYRYKVG